MSDKVLAVALAIFCSSLSVAARQQLQSKFLRQTATPTIQINNTISSLQRIDNVLHTLFREGRASSLASFQPNIFTGIQKLYEHNEARQLFQGDGGLGCQIIPGYTAYDGVDHPGNDLICTRVSVDVLAARCNTLPWCVSINTDGCLKWKQNTTGTIDKNGFCFYVKDVINIDCPAVPGFDVQQGRGYNDMTPTSDISIGTGCFRHLSVIQLAQECLADASCNAFDSWGCLKSYNFLNDNGLGASYCFYTKSTGVTDFSYCIQGWNVDGGDAGQVANTADTTACLTQCTQHPDCTYIVWDPQSLVCNLKQDLMDGSLAYTATTTLCTQGQPTCPPVTGFRAYFGRESQETWPYTCGRSTTTSAQQRLQLAAECLATPGCAGFDLSGCLAQNPVVDSNLVVNCFYERIDFSSSPDCSIVSGYAVYQRLDHYGYALDGSCFRNQTRNQTAQDCNATPDCAAFNSFNCLLLGDNVTVNYNGRSDDFCLYSKESIINLPQATLGSGASFEGSTSQCEPVPGYTAYPGADHTGDNIPGTDCINATVQDLAAKCNDLPWCVSFNTNGCLKYKATTTDFNKTDGFCFYTKDVSMACPHVPGFYVQQGRGYNDMTADGDISIGRGCFRNVSIAQLAQECQSDLNCNSFDSRGCLKNYTFLNDNGLGPSYCFYTLIAEGTADATPYCIQGWDVVGTNVATYSNITDLASCQQLCWQNPSCTFSTWNNYTLSCYNKQDMLFGKDGVTQQEDVLTFCTKGTPTCPQIPGFRSYFASQHVGDVWPFTCGRPGMYPLDVAVQCLATPGCAGFDITGCLTLKSGIDTRLIPTCFWERIYYQPGSCTEVPGYTSVPPGFGHVGDDLVGTCGRNQTVLQTAEGCNAAPSCTAINSYGCIKLGGNVTVNDNALSNSYCYYTKNMIASPPPASTILASPRPLPIPAVGNMDATPAKGKSVSAGAIAGIAVGGAAALLAILFSWKWRRKHNHQSDTYSPQHPAGQPEVCVRLAQNVAAIPGLNKGEAFMITTAHEYVWNDTTDTNSFTAVTASNENELALTGSAGPAIQLTSQQVKEQIQLLRHGYLGRGATALVFKGLWPSRFGESAMVAVKLLQNGHAIDAYAMKSIMYEAGVLASLYSPHPNVIRLYGYCLEPPTVCLILEVLPGSLKDKLHPKPYKQRVPQVPDVQEDNPRDAAPNPSPHININVNPAVADIPQEKPGLQTAHAAACRATSMRLSMNDVLQISIDIVTALKYLHDMPLAEDAVMIETDTVTIGEIELLPSTSVTEPSISNKKHMIVHRDLKPANILLDAAGHAKISDFGLARRQMQDTMETRNLAAGTLPYMAPELLVSKELHSARFHATNRVDIYSMGMIMWEMLAGQTPWGRMHEHSLVNAVLSGRRPELPVKQQDDQPAVSLSEMPASLHALPEFNNIIKACWNHREHQRPSAAALYDMLTSLRDKYI